MRFKMDDTINLSWLSVQVYDTIGWSTDKKRGKHIIMSNKPLPDLKTFIENVNKKDKKRNGLKIRFAFTNRKRKG